MSNLRQKIKILAITLSTVLFFSQTGIVLALAPGEEYTFKFNVTCGNGATLVPFKEAEIGLFKHEGDTPLLGGGYLEAVTAYQAISLNENGQGEFNFQFQQNQLLPGDYYWGISYGGNRLTKVEEDKFAFYTDHYGFFDRVSFKLATVYAENVYPKQSAYKFNLGTCPAGFQPPVSGNAQTGGSQSTPAIPEIVSPADKQTLGSEGDYMFEVKPVDGATSYLWGFYKNGQLVYEIDQDLGKVDPFNKLTLKVGQPGHDKLGAGDVIVAVKAYVNNKWSEAGKININIKPKSNQPAPEFKELGNGSVLDFGGDYGFIIKPVEGATKYKLKLFQSNPTDPKKPAIYEVSAEADKFRPNYEFGANKDSSTTDTKFTPGDVEVSISVEVNGQWSDSRTITIKLTANQNDADRIKGARQEIKTNLSSEVCLQNNDQQKKACQSAISDCVEEMTNEEVRSDNNKQKRQVCGEKGKAAAQSVDSAGQAERLKKRQAEEASALSNTACAKYKDQQKTACGNAIASCVSRYIMSADAVIPDGTSVKMIKNCSVEGDEAAKKAAQSPGQPRVEGDRQAKTEADTITKAYIHGEGEGKIDLDVGEDWFSVGSRTFVGKNEKDCVPGNVDLTLTKISEKDQDNKDKIVAIDIPISKIPVSFNNVLGELDSDHRTCWSYQAKLEGVKKAGVYQLDAKYRGSGSYKTSKGSVKVTFTTNKGIIETVTKVQVSGLAQTNRLLKSLAKVAGVAVQQDGDQVKIINDPSNNKDTVTLIPQSSIKGGSCDPQNLPILHFSVVKILNSGDVETVYDNPQYPNCEPWVMNVSQLGDLSQINRIEASASLLDNPGSEYKASQGQTVIKIGDNLVKAKPFVKLSSNPSVANIAAGDTLTIIATTNSVVTNPIFEVTQNGQTRSIPASLSNSEYLLEIPMADGEYTIKFTNGEVADTLSFSTKSKPQASVESVGLLMGGQEVPLALDGGMIDITLGSATNNFLLVIHYTDGTESRKSLNVNYEQPKMPQGLDPDLNNGPSAVTPQVAATGSYYWYCETSNIIEIDPSGNKREHTRCSDYGQQCRPINTPGYKSDAECYTPQESTQTPISGCRWEQLPGVSASECNWETHQVYDVYQNTCTGEYDRRNYQYKKGECGYTGQQTSPTSVPQIPQGLDPSLYDASQINNEGAAGQPCIYSEADGKCFNGTIKSQSTCGGKTPSNVCINPSGGCEYGGSQVDCATGEAI